MVRDIRGRPPGESIELPGNIVLDPIINALRKGEETSRIWNERNRAQPEEKEPNAFAVECAGMLPKDAVIMEIGIGSTGRDLRYFAKTLPESRVIGVDISNEALNNTKRIAAEEGISDRIYLAQANERFLPIAGNGKLDAVYARSSLYLTHQELMKLLEYLKKALKTDGKIMIEGKSAEDVRIRRTENLGGGLSVDAGGHIRRVWTEKGIREILIKTGFELQDDHIGNRVEYRGGEPTTFLNFIAKAAREDEQK